MLRKIRITLALIFAAGITLLFCGIGSEWWGWMAGLQFLPSCLALNFGAIAIILLLTFVFGRLYCSVICPLGVYQDLVVFLRRSYGRIADRRRAARLRAMKDKGLKPAAVKPSAAKVFGYRKEHTVVRYAVLAFALVCAFTSLQFLLALIAPYSAYGRMIHAAAGLFGADGVGAPLAITAAVTFAVITFLAWKRGRAYCNTICPVGTTLSLVSRFSLFRPVIDESKCIACGRCYKRCKASCIDGQAHKIDYSRCLVCFDCLDNCTEGALKYRFVGLRGAGMGPVSGNASGKGGSPNRPGGTKGPAHGDGTGSGKAAEGATGSPDRGSAGTGSGRAGSNASAAPTASGKSDAARPDNSRTDSGKSDAGRPDNSSTDSGKSGSAKDLPADSSRRAFLTTAAVAGAALTLGAQNKRLDGGLAPVTDKQAPARSERLIPPGALSVRNFYDRCTACQLCVSNCPGGVLRPSTDLGHFLQPQMGYENGYCRPECTKCGELCPAGAISPISREEKTTVKIGTARVDLELCFAANGKENCGNCARHCPSGAIRMVDRHSDGRRIPVASEEQCTGCGACEFLCPSRPISAITVDGLSIHRTKTR